MSRPEPRTSILKGAQDGGIVTQLFAYALETGIIDGAIVAGPSDEPWKPRPMVAMTKDDLLKSRGTRYNLCRSVSFIKEATRSYGLDKVGNGIPTVALRFAQLSAPA